jgi:hypothetical protein
MSTWAILDSLSDCNSHSNNLSCLYFSCRIMTQRFYDRNVALLPIDSGQLMAQSIAQTHVVVMVHMWQKLMS